MRGAARRIACFAVSAHSASPVVAYAESGGLDPKIHVHQVDTLERVATLEGCASLGITALAFSRDGRYLAVASAAPDPTLAVRVAATGETLVKMDLRSEATRVAFDPFARTDSWSRTRAAACWPRTRASRCTSWTRRTTA